MPEAPDPRKKPTDVKVQVSTGAGLDIVWADGHRSHYDFVFLRDECPCATCNDQRKKKAEAKAPAAMTGSSVLPMYKPKMTARAAKPLGNYALQIEFNDGHSSGIFSYAFLREICPCAECARDFRSGAA
jgi:DUF971 family protein